MKRLLLALLVLASATPALAQQKPDTSALEASGNKHYSLAEYDAAIADFKEAFRISDEPGFLYNIAQSYRLKNDCREASTFYKNYLRKATEANKGTPPANAVKVHDFIEKMDECAKTQAPPPTTTTPTTTTPTTTAQTTPQPEQPETPETPAPVANSRGWMKWAGLAGVGLGAIGGGLGIKFALDSKGYNDDLKTKCATSCTSEEALGIQSDGKAANRNAVIFGVAGGALFVGGAVLFVLSMTGGSSQPADAEPAASLQFTRGGATASYAWRF